MGAVTAIVAFVNQKGGVGKTSVTLGMASAARAAGHRVLVVDLDPQASATWVLGVDPTKVERSTGDLLHKGKPGSAERATVASAWGELVDVVPAGPGLQDYESGDGKHPAGRLRSALEGATGRYDLVLVDCAPSLGNLTMNALTAATHAVLVVEPAALSLRGVGAVADLIDQVWADHNSDLDLAGVIVNKVPAVSSEADRRYDELTRIVGKKAVWQPVVPARVVVNQATADRQPIHSYGYRATEVIDAFDHLYAKLRRVTRKT
jgi:cellulose biosynthesis protein BcsQ